MSFRPATTLPSSHARVERSRWVLIDFLQLVDPPYLPPALVANERDCELRAKYLGSLLHHVIAHTDVVLRDLRSQMSSSPDFSHLINSMIEMRDEIMGYVENAGGEK